jgi:hypothetical protein
MLPVSCSSVTKMTPLVVSGCWRIVTMPQAQASVQGVAVNATDPTDLDVDTRQVSCREVMQACLERFDLVALPATQTWPPRHLAATGAGTTAASRPPFNSPGRSPT